MEKRVGIRLRHLNQKEQVSSIKQQIKMPTVPQQRMVNFSPMSRKKIFHHEQMKERTSYPQQQRKTAAATLNFLTTQNQRYAQLIQSLENDNKQQQLQLLQKQQFINKILKQMNQLKLQNQKYREEIVRVKSENLYEKQKMLSKNKTHQYSKIYDSHNQTQIEVQNQSLQYLEEIKSPFSQQSSQYMNKNKDINLKRQPNSVKKSVLEDNANHTFTYSQHQQSDLVSPLMALNSSNSDHKGKKVNSFPSNHKIIPIDHKKQRNSDQINTFMNYNREEQQYFVPTFKQNLNHHNPASSSNPQNHNFYDASTQNTNPYSDKPSPYDNNNKKCGTKFEQLKIDDSKKFKFEDFNQSYSSQQGSDYFF